MNDLINIQNSPLCLITLCLKCILDKNIIIDNLIDDLKDKHDKFSMFYKTPCKIYCKNKKSNRSQKKSILKNIYETINTYVFKYMDVCLYDIYDIFEMLGISSVIDYDDFDDFLNYNAREYSCQREYNFKTKSYCIYFIEDYQQNYYCKRYYRHICIVVNK